MISEITNVILFLNSIIDTTDKPEEVAKINIDALNAKKMKIRYMAKSVTWQGTVQMPLCGDAFEDRMIGMKLK